MRPKRSSRLSRRRDSSAARSRSTAVIALRCTPRRPNSSACAICTSASRSPAATRCTTCSIARTGRYRRRRVSQTPSASNTRPITPHAKVQRSSASTRASRNSCCSSTPARATRCARERTRVAESESTPDCRSASMAGCTSPMAIARSASSSCTAMADSRPAASASSRRISIGTFERSMAARITAPRSSSETSVSRRASRSGRGEPGTKGGASRASSRRAACSCARFSWMRSWSTKTSRARPRTVVAAGTSTTTNCTASTAT